MASHVDEMTSIPSSPERRPAPLFTPSPTETCFSGIATFESDNTDQTSFFPPLSNNVEVMQDSNISTDETKVSASNEPQTTESTNIVSGTLESNRSEKIATSDSILPPVVESSLEALPLLPSSVSPISSKPTENQPSQDNGNKTDNHSTNCAIKSTSNNSGGSGNKKRKKQNRLDQSIVSSNVETNPVSKNAKTEDAKVDIPAETKMDTTVEPNKTKKQLNKTIIQSSAPVTSISSEGKKETEPAVAVSKPHLSTEEKEALKRLVADKKQHSTKVSPVSSNVPENSPKNLVSRLLLFVLLIIVPIVTLGGVALVMWPEVTKGNSNSSPAFLNIEIPSTLTTTTTSSISPQHQSNSSIIPDTNCSLVKNDTISAGETAYQQQIEKKKEESNTSVLPPLQQQQQHQQSSAVTMGTPQWRRPFQNLLMGIKQKFDKLIHAFFPWSRKNKSHKV